MNTAICTCVFVVITTHKKNMCPGCVCVCDSALERSAPQWPSREQWLSLQGALALKWTADLYKGVTSPRL